MSSASRSPAELAGALRGNLLTAEQAAAIDVPGMRDAAALIPLYEHAGELRVVLTVRREDLRLHPGQVSFPGGSADPGEALERAALREAWEEIGLDPHGVVIAGCLPPTATFVSGFRIHTFVGTVAPGMPWTASESEVSSVIDVSIDEVRSGYARRVIDTPRGPFTHGTYLLGDHLVWGATARIMAHLLKVVP